MHAILSFQFDDVLKSGWQEVNQGTRNLIQKNVSCDKKKVNHILILIQTSFFSWIVVDGLGPQILLTTQNQLMIAAMKTWEAIAEFWPDLPLKMDLIRQRK